MSHRALCLFALMGLLASSDATAEIYADPSNGRLDATFAGSGYRVWTVKAAGGSIIARRDTGTANGTSAWTGYGYGSAPAKLQGPAATWYNDGGNITEIVVYVATDGNLNVGRVINNGPITWFNVGSLGGGCGTLTGHVAATTYVQGSNRYLLVGATTICNSLYRYVGIISQNFNGGWSDASAGLAWIPTAPLAATTSPSGTIASIFGAHTPLAESLGMMRWNGSTWATTNLGRPSGRRVCGSITAAQASLNTLTPRLVVACTNATNLTSEIYLAVSGSFNSTAFSWTIYTSPTFSVHRRLGSTARPLNQFQGTYAIDVYLSSINPSNRIEKGVYTTSGFTISDMGFPPEAAEIDGETMAVVPFGTTSRAFYIGKIANSAGSRKYLYERFGNVVNAPYNYRSFGDSDFNSFGYSDYYAEGKISTWNGITAASMIRRPLDAVGEADCAQVHMFYSPDEGKTLLAPTPVPNQVNGIEYEYVSDPTAVVTDQGKMFSVQVGVAFPQDEDDGTPPVCKGYVPSDSTERVIYAVSTTPSTYPNFSTPLILQPAADNDADHPYADIQHVPGVPDVIHVAWNVGFSLFYTAFAEDAIQSQIVVHTLHPTSGGPARVTAADSGRVIVYYGQTINGEVQVQFCEINSTRDACVNGFGLAPFRGSTPGPGSNPRAWGIGIKGTSANDPNETYIRIVYPYSMAVSESGDKLYYCFHRMETNGESVVDDDFREETDVYCATATRDPSTGVWSWPATAVPIAGVENDDKDQFLPEVVVTQEQGNYSSVGETAIVTYYDRSDDPLNDRYQVKKTVTIDRGVTYAVPRAQFGGVSGDPENLPRHALASPHARFIGDYNGSEGTALHSQSLSVLSLTPGTVRTTVFGNLNSLGHWNE